ncbi:two-component system capsular synthesis response regulator RcsB [Burkholderia ambifaria]|nr:LuxR C-terminal-related transcriptional regulator [Burkholderia ambifaria]MDR6504143.1 two-component system capsular synthesis response regulator RcsB [Burkholderia ambifaria]
MDNFSIRVVLADDHPAMLAGVEHGLTGVPTINVCGRASNSTELIERLKQGDCNVLVSDYAMPGGEYGDGLSLFSYVQRHFPAVRLVVLTMLDNPAVLSALMAQRIDCIISKSDAVNHLIPAIHAAATGGTYLSPTIDRIVRAIDPNRRGRASVDMLSKRELEVVRLFVTGMTISEIAERLQRSAKTISTQKARAMQKLGVTRDVDLVRYSIESGIVSSSASATSDGDPAAV